MNSELLADLVKYLPPIVAERLKDEPEALRAVVMELVPQAVLALHVACWTEGSARIQAIRLVFQLAKLIEPGRKGGP